MNNSIDAYDKAFELLLAARYHSEDINFQWERWEQDVDSLVKKVYLQEPNFHAYRNAIKYTVTVLPADQGGNILPHRKRDGDEG